MSMESDVIVDRRRLRRKLTFWRVASALIVIGAVVAVGAYATPWGGKLTGASAIQRVSIDGLIRSDQKRVEALERLGKSNAPAVIVHINSPGGTTAGSEELYDALTRLKAKKPMVVVVEGLGASGGYIAALASDHIVAQQTALVGSIGVLFQYPNFTDLLKTVGVKVEEVKSSPLKAAPNGYEPTSPEARAAIDALSEGFLRLVSRSGAEPARHGRCTTRESRRWARFHRTAGGRPQVGRSAWRRKDCDRVACGGKESRARPAGARFQVVAAFDRSDVYSHRRVGGI